MSAQRPSVSVAVVVEREAEPNAWEDWRFRVAEVVEQQEAFGETPHKLHDDGKFARWIHPGFTLELFRDEGEGYYLNLSSGRPVWFVVTGPTPERLKSSTAASTMRCFVPVMGSLYRNRLRSNIFLPGSFLTRRCAAVRIEPDAQVRLARGF